MDAQASDLDPLFEIADRLPEEQPDWWRKYRRQADSRVRGHCEECGAFVRNANRGSWTSNPMVGEEYHGPVCEPGKGCQRTINEKEKT